ncbi:MAG: hypothetical protein ACOVQE_11115 [Chitinophagaceae bacterium]
MSKRNFCGGFVYNQSSWNQYWEGNFLRNNENIGTVKSQSVMAMANYGITSKWNVLASTQWISNRATAGTLIQQQGVQDLSVFLKNEFFSKEIKGFSTSLVAVAGFSVPLTNYVADYLPLSIGFQSRTASLRLLADIQKGHWYSTLSAAYVHRSNVTIDRDTYYTTSLIQSNKVAMPNVVLWNVRVGWRDGGDKYYELVADKMATQDGFDIRKNDMPFLSNKMAALRLGVNIKQPLGKQSGFSVMLTGMQTLTGRNMGKSTQFSTGIVYQFEWKKKQQK